MADIWQWKGDATTGAGYMQFTGSQTVVISGTATAVISGTTTVVVSGTATVNFSSSGTVELTGSITPTHTAVDVTTTTGEVLAANANRKYALLVNDSDTVQYLKIGAAAVLNQGIRLNANGGSYEMAAALGNLATGAINGIHGGSGNKVITVLEGV